MQYIIIVILAATILTSYFFGAHNANKDCELDKLEQQQKFSVIMHEQSVKFQEYQVESQSKFNDLQKRLQNEIKTDDAYKRDIPANGVRLLSEAIALANSR